MKRPRFAIVAVLAVAAGAVGVTVGATTASGKSSSTKASAPIVIGAAVDLTSSMKPFDSPALAGAQIEAKKLAAKGGPNFQIKVCNHQLKKQKSCAAQLIQAGAKVAIVTCDVEYAAAATQEFINKGILALSPCVTTDQMGPQRFGSKGRLAFTIGGTAQDEGSAEAEYAWSRGWKTAIVVKDNFLVYFRDVSDAFAKRFQELGGKIVAREAFASFDKTIGNVISKVAPQKADVISFVTAFGELPQFVAGIRSAGNKTPIINSWGGDGTYWNPKNPQVTDYYVDNYASSFGDDPNPQVNALLKALLAAKKVPYTASYVLGAATIDVLAAALKKTGGSTDGLALAKAMEKFKNVPTISGPITFSPTLHSVVNRPWRIMKVQNNKETYVRMWKTKKVAKIH
ncbi:MAG TPA: ABC transporter substrate-binding protein [Gaiellaceae bacterium]|nr:ABC transporter substrate-binding protein [Gaiellaceae bacterium]